MKDRAYLFFVVNYLAQGLAGLAYEPVSYFLKDGLGLGPAQAAAFVSWMTLPLTVKPLFGPLTDLLPWRGRRRAPHLLAAALLTSACWLALAALGVPSYAAALALLVLVNVGTVTTDVVCDGVMVERGRALGKTAAYQATQIGALYLTLVVTGLGGGWLSQHASWRAAFLLAAVFPLLSAASVLWVEEPVAASPGEAVARGRLALARLAADPAARATALGIFLFSFTPFLGTAQFYYQAEHLGLSPLFIGGLATAGGFAGLAGAGLFGALTARGWDSGRLARLSVLAGAPLSLLYLFYTGPVAALALTVVFGLSGVAFRLAWMDLAARVCPEGAEATSYAAFMSVFNLAALASNALGGALYASLSARHGPWSAMVALTLIGSAATLACWPLIPLGAQGTTRRAPR
ncbi:MAG: MFS transporter [Elusimicrobiota bacterium]|nr:MFS transporter [Elusimicrobiota bacterium]